jgi:hypothetical protein
MVTPAAPRSRITSAALISIFVRVSQRFVRALVGVLGGTVVPSGSRSVCVPQYGPVHITRAEAEVPAPWVGYLAGESIDANVQLDDPHYCLPAYAVPAIMGKSI